MQNEKLMEILQKHKIWLNNGIGGEKADLRYANLSDADSRYELSLMPMTRLPGLKLFLI